MSVSVIRGPRGSGKVFASRVLALLKRRQFQQGRHDYHGPSCIECGGFQDEGCAPDCEIAALIRELS